MTFHFILMFGFIEQSHLSCRGFMFRPELLEAKRVFEGGITGCLACSYTFLYVLHPLRTSAEEKILGWVHLV